jgi:hypothetical protein
MGVKFTIKAMIIAASQDRQVRYQTLSPVTLHNRENSSTTIVKPNIGNLAIEANLHPRPFDEFEKLTLIFPESHRVDRKRSNTAAVVAAGRTEVCARAPFMQDCALHRGR